MNNLLNILAAKNEGWEQLIIILVIFGFAIIKKIISVIKNMAEESRQNQEEQQKPLPPPRKHPKYAYDRNSDKTLEELRAEKIAQIRAAFGIPQPQEPVRQPIYEQPQQRPIVKKKYRPAEPVIAKEEKPSQVQPKSHTEHKPSVEPVRTFLHLATQEDLRQAIIYQEVLGKPLALRE